MQLFKGLKRLFRFKRITADSSEGSNDPLLGIYHNLTRSVLRKTL